MKIKKVGVGMMERDAEFVGPDDFPSLEAFWETLRPRPIDDSGRTAQANALEDFLRARANWTWTGSASDLAFFFGTFPEDSAESLAALWLSSYARLKQLSAELASDPAGAEKMERLLREAEQLGTLKERMFWRAGIDPASGQKRESLAITGRSVKIGQKEAAEQTARAHAGLRAERFQRMSELVPEVGVENAARTCEAEGLGGWQGIKRQWDRHRKKRDT